MTETICCETVALENYECGFYNVVNKTCKYYSGIYFFTNFALLSTREYVYTDPAILRHDYRNQ